MTRPATGGIEVADIVRAHGADYLTDFGHVTTGRQRRVLRNLADCRTAALGGHKRRCDHCGHEEIAYNSCRDRHCPKCQAMARAEWMESQASDLLPVPYFHVVFTVPQSIAAVALQNKRIVYGVLFRAASQTLLEIAADPKHLGAQIGFLVVLHTWGQNLLHHPHVHCVVPGGGLSPDGSRWVSCRPNFFLSVRILSKVFRGKFLAFLREAYRREKLNFCGQLTALRHPKQFERLLNTAAKCDWVVYAKPPFGGPEQVLKYLARYTHRVAISNKRLISMEAGKVTFRWKDYADGHQKKTMTLDALEFIRRFLLHVLPRGFVRIRHFGFLANRVRQHKLARCRELLGTTKAAASGHPVADIYPPADERRSDRDGCVCPVCKTGHMLIVEWLSRSNQRSAVAMLRAVVEPWTTEPWDSS